MNQNPLNTAPAEQPRDADCDAATAPLNSEPEAIAKEWLNVLDDAASHDLVDTATAKEIRAGFDQGKLQGKALEDQCTQALRAGKAAERALNFLGNLFKPDDVIELRALDPFRQEGPTLYRGRLCEANERSKMAAFINSNLGIRNIYVGLNPRKSEAANTSCSAKALKDTVGEIVRGRTHILLDLDNKDADSASPDGWEPILVPLAHLGPKAIVATGNGYHVWLDTKETPGDSDTTSEDSAHLNATLTGFGSDPVGDLARIARLPYTVNIPDDGKRKRNNVLRLATPIVEVANAGH